MIACFQLDVQRGRHHFGDAVHVGVRHIHGPAHVFDRRFGRHGAESDDLRDIFAAILAGHVVDDLAAAVHAEINVNIGHGNAFGIQKALEDQFMLQRIKVGDAERVRNQRTRRRTAARADRNVVLAGVADEIPHDQEISGKLHLLDDGKFPRQPLFVVREAVFQASLALQRTQRLQPAREAFPGYVFEIAVEGVSRRARRNAGRDC